MRDIDELFAALAESEFRARFRLGRKEQALLAERGLPVMLEHARTLLGQRLAPAEIAGDGRQTPTRGHPVFIAQHATATCCRGCLEKWHRIPSGRELDEAEMQHVLRVIERWLAAQPIPADAQRQRRLFE